MVYLTFMYVTTIGLLGLNFTFGCKLICFCLKKEFIINVVLLISVNLLVKISYLFIIEVNVQNTLGPSEYGLFLAFFNLTYLFHFINDPGIHSYNIKLIASTENENPKSKLARTLPYILGTKSVLAFIYLLVIFFVGYILRYEKELFPLIVLVGLNHVLSSIFLYIRSNFSATGHFRIESFLSALDKMLMLIIIGFFILTGQVSLWNFIIGQSMAFGLAIVTTTLILKGKAHFRAPIFSLTFTLDLLRKSLPFAIILLLMASYNRMDGVMLERILPDGSYQAGIYAASFRYMEAANMVVYLIAGLLLPMYASANRRSDILQLTDFGIRTVAAVAITIGVNIIVFRKFWMSIYTVGDVQYDELVVFHMLSFFCIAVSYVYGTLITAKAVLKEFNILLFCGVIINLLVNLYLIPINNAVGAAQATFITQLIMTMGQFYLARKYFQVPIDMGLAIRITMYIFILSLLLLGLREWNKFPGVYMVVIGGLISIIIAFMTGVVRKDMIFALIVIKGKGNVPKGNE